jgi:hypothetical protein
LNSVTSIPPAKLKKNAKRITLNSNSVNQAAIETIREAIALIIARHPDIDHVEAERVVLQQFEFMYANSNEVISAKRIVERYEEGISRNGADSSAIRRNIEKSIFKGLSGRAPTRSMPYYELQSTFQAATGESLSQYVVDVLAVVEQLQENGYIRWERPGGRLPLIFQGIDFDEWGDKMTQEKDSARVITYNVTGSNARINHHSTDLSTNVVGDNRDIQDQLEALRRAIRTTQISDSERQSALEVVDAVDAEFSSGRPKKSVVTALLSALPRAAEIATIASTIIPFMN